jgi:tetrahydromethanopterin S-methyltransferase subunit A
MKNPVISEKAKLIKGEYHPIRDWIIDPKGYFLIRINKKRNLIELGYCKKNNVIEKIIEGKTPQEVYFTAIRRGLISRMDHAAYLGKELEKAYLALKNNLEYVQDSELKIK